MSRVRIRDSDRIGLIPVLVNLGLEHGIILNHSRNPDGRFGAQHFFSGKGEKEGRERKESYLRLT